MTTQLKQREIKHGWRFNDFIEMKHEKFERETKSKKKGVDTETVVFEIETPVGFNMRELRRRIWNICRPLIRGRRKKVEFHLDRFPQVGTVMGEINASLPKPKRLEFGWSTDDETNTLFIIETPKRK